MTYLKSLCLFKSWIKNSCTFIYVYIYILKANCNLELLNLSIVLFNSNWILKQANFVEKKHKFTSVLLHRILFCWLVCSSQNVRRTTRLILGELMGFDSGRSEWSKLLLFALCRLRIPGLKKKNIKQMGKGRENFFYSIRWNSICNCRRSAGERGRYIFITEEWLMKAHLHWRISRSLCSTNNVNAVIN